MTAKLLIVDARLRAGNRESARTLFLTIDAHVPVRLQHAYAVAAALVALSLRDDNIRRRALSAFGKMPSAAVESDESIQTLLAALDDNNWAEQR
jgi:hypothetical protein